ncbi:uncharacterized protein [Nicotiana sylvestris]|uniref:uncharacterized protein n=1 Tax=Nicotiana sylvestris TaxID=4096 RepID=UPI00388C6FFC
MEQWKRSNNGEDEAVLLAASMVDNGGLPWWPAKRPHLQEFVKASQEQWDWLAKEHEYRVTIGKLEKQVLDLKFERDLHIATDEGEKRKLAQENEVLKAQIREMKIATRNPKRSRADEKLINGPKKKVLEYQEDLEKYKAGLARIQLKWIKKAEERAWSMKQMKRDYERNIAILRETISTLEERFFRQARDTRADRKRYYDLVARMEKQMNEFQDQLLYNAQMLGTRNQQIEQLFMERDRIRGRIEKIGHYITMSPKEKSTGGEEVVQLEKVDVKPVVVMGKSSPVITKNPEPVKVTVQGVPSKPACIGPVVIRPVMQMPITSEKAVPWSYSKAMVMYKGKEVVEEVCETQGLTCSGRCFAPVELRRSNPAVVKKPVTEEEAEEFLKKMKAQDYSIVEQLRKTPTQISLL